jgi:hypothetical protein
MIDLLEADVGTTSSESALKGNFRLARDLPGTEPAANVVAEHPGPDSAAGSRSHTTSRRRRHFGYGILLTSNQVLQVIAAL